MCDNCPFIYSDSPISASDAHSIIQTIACHLALNFFQSINSNISSIGLMAVAPTVASIDTSVIPLYDIDDNIVDLVASGLNYGIELAFKKQVFSSSIAPIIETLDLSEISLIIEDHINIVKVPDVSYAINFQKRDSNLIVIYSPIIIITS